MGKRRKKDKKRSLKRGKEKRRRIKRGEDRKKRTNIKDEGKFWGEKAGKKTVSNFRYRKK